MKKFTFIIFLTLLIMGCSSTPGNSGNEASTSLNEKNQTGNLSVKIYSSLVKGPLVSKACVEVSGGDFPTISSHLTIDYTSNLIYGTVSQIPAGKKRVCEVKLFDGENNLTGYGVTSNITILPSKTTPVTIWIFLTENGSANVKFNIFLKGYTLDENVLVKATFLNFTNEFIPLSSNFSVDFTNCPLVENAFLRLIINDKNYEIFNNIILSNISITKASNYSFNVIAEIGGGECEVNGIITNGNITSLYLIDNFENIQLALFILLR